MFSLAARLLPLILRAEPLHEATLRSSLLLVSLCLTLLLIATDAHAQAAPCAARGLDAFESARRARRVVEDYAALHDAIRRDLDHLDHAQLTVGQALPSMRLFAAPIADVSIWPSVPTCYEDVRRDANLQGIRFGGIAGADLRELDLRVEVFWVTGGDSLNISIPNPDGFVPAEGEPDPNDVSLGQTQRMIGGRAQIARWADVTLGFISDDAPPQPGTTSQDRLYLALGVPLINLRSDVILNSEDQSLQTFYLNIERLPITASGLAVTARGGYLEDEAQVFTTLGLAIPIKANADSEKIRTPSDPQREGSPTIDYTSVWGSFARLYPEISVEWDDPRLRHARLRAEVQRVVLSAYDDKDVAGVMGVPYADMSLFWEGTTFNSRALEQRVGERYAWGYGGGARFLFGIRPMSIAFDTSFHLNRPETIAQISELTGAGEWRMLLSWRLGW